MDFSTTNTIKIKFYSVTAGTPVQVKIEDESGASTAEVSVNSSVNGGWETI